MPYALGRKLEFLDGEGPKLEPLRTAADIAKLDGGKFHARLEPVYEALQKTREALDAEGFSGTSLIGFAGAPWTVAAYMVEGSGSKDFIEAKKMAYADPEIMAALIDVLVEYTASYLIRQAQAGAEALQIFDSWAGVLDETLFRRLVISPTKKIVEIVRDSLPHIPVIGFPRGAGRNYLAYAEETGVTALGLDYQVSTKWAAQTLQPRLPVQGNLDPACLFAGGDALVLAVEKILGDLGKGPFVFNLGHGVHKDTPVENVEKLAKIIREFRPG